MTTWEYKAISVEAFSTDLSAGRFVQFLGARTTNTAAVNARLAEMAAIGWELVSMISTKEGFWYSSEIMMTFKRPVSGGPEES